MIYQCDVCLRMVHLNPYHAVMCQCGAIYTVQMVTTDTTALKIKGKIYPKDFDRAHQQAVPKAFYDAFEEKELQL